MRELTRSDSAVSDSSSSGQPFPEAIERAIGRANRPLTWMWVRGFRFLFVLDAIALYAAMVTINMVRFGWDWPTYPRSHYWVGFAMAVAIHLAVDYFVGLYEREPRLGHRSWIPRIAVAMATGVAIDGLAAFATDRYLMPRLNLIALFFVGTLALNANRGMSRYFANRRRGPSRVLLVGRGEAVVLATRHFDGDADAVVVGTVADPTLLFDAVHATDATDVLLLDLAAFADAFPEPLTALDREGIGVHQRVSARETLLGLQSVREIAGMPFTRMRTHAMASHQLKLKRLFDVATVLVLAPVALVVIGLLALYVRVRAGGPVLFRQTRVGLQGQRFDVMKFRTMVPDAEKLGPQLSNREDGRVIPALRWMRSTRADELPQLWNILRGQMSLVGPRPERPELIAAIERDVAGYARRHELPPGLTGLAQINGRYDTDADYKLGYDLQYLVNWSLALDVQILLRTIWVVLTRRV